MLQNVCTRKRRHSLVAIIVRRTPECEVWKVPSHRNDVTKGNLGRQASKENPPRVKLMKIERQIGQRGKRLGCVTTWKVFFPQKTSAKERNELASQRVTRWQPTRTKMIYPNIIETESCATPITSRQQIFSLFVASMLPTLGEWRRRWGSAELGK